VSWKSVNLGDAYWFQEGPGVRNWQFTDNGIKLINVANIEKLGQINLAKTSRHLSVEEVEAKYKHFLCDAGDLVIASSGISFDEDGFLRTRGAFIKDEHLPLCLNTSTIRFKPKNSNDLIFFKHWLQSLNFRRQITKLVTGSAQQNFGPSHLKQLKIPLPPLPEQKRIAAILDKADELKRKREAAITKLDQLAQSIFVEMFGDVIVNDKGWQILRLGDVGTLDRGVSKHRPRNAPELLGGDYPLVQTGEVANCDGYIRSHNSSYSELGLRQSKIWPAGTLCITIAANIAKTGILTFDACFPDSVVGFRADNAATVEYVRVWLSFLQKMLEESAPESAQKNINLAILRELSIPFPPITLQEEFRNRLKAMQTLKVKFSTALAKQNNLFTSLQHQAFAGQLVP
jgi:type I restriction enzyme, S subunit